MFCEGKNTEPSYFEALRVACDRTLVRIETIGGSGDPSAVTSAAIRKRQEILKNRQSGSADSFEEGDQVWAIFDRDNFAHYETSIERCRANDVGAAWSNPCFEIWLILHLEEFDRPDGHKAVQKHFQLLRPEYDPNRGKRPNCQEIVKFVVDAETRALRQLDRRRDEGMPGGPPATSVASLTQAIRKAAEDARPKI